MPDRVRQVRHEQVVDRVSGQYGQQRIEEIFHLRFIPLAATSFLPFCLHGPTVADILLRHPANIAWMLELSTPVQFVKGIGPRLAEVLAAKGISIVDDLLHYLPFRYEDRLNPRSVAELRAGEMATVIAEVRNSGLFRTRRMPIFQLTVGQGTSKLKCVWFNASYLKDRFQPGQMLALYGKVEADRDGHLQIMQPQFEVLGDVNEQGGADEAEKKAAASLEIGRIVPIYESAGQGKLTPRWFRRIIRWTLENLNPDFPDPIPGAVRGHLSLLSPLEALWKVHWPDAGESFSDLQSSRTPAHIRMIFDELFFIELGLELKRREQKAQTGIPFQLESGARDAIKKILPFHPTSAQKRVLKEIAIDMKAASPMRRLLQGDVGSGKTIVAFQAAIIAIENGYQVALMAPTEILAQQHFFSARQILEATGYRIVLLTGSLEQDRKRDIQRHIAQGNAQLIIGTHALIQDRVAFKKLGLVIVDEQHRFGVMQRLKLMRREKTGTADTSGKPDEIAGRGNNKVVDGEPDVLVMTATPIPRTLALTLYGDLDVSVLDELPPGRTPVVTRIVPDERADEVWEFVQKQIAGGHQAYVVYPIIEENEENEIKAAKQMHRQLREKIFPNLHVGLLHGRLASDEKEHIMREFQQGKIEILVATTVIEVGVDVPNATIMVIEHADRFGLAQLHQLRGRIGRGAAKSYCLLMRGGKISEEGERRLDAMVRSNDGFQIAELDLELRGPGEFFGTKQAGIPSFRVANIIRDRELLEAAKREAALVISGPNQEISSAELDRALREMRSRWSQSYGLVEVG
jgi:ATP-dependent DNA helicase RecG